MILSKISYCGYLLQYIVIQVTAYNYEGTFTDDNLLLFWDFLGNAVITIVAAILLMLLIEMPFVNIENEFIFRRAPRKIESGSSLSRQELQK